MILITRAINREKIRPAINNKVRITLFLFKEFATKCMHEAGVAIVPGTAFGKTAKDYVRFSFAASSDNISQALDKIKKILK